MAQPLTTRFDTINTIRYMYGTCATHSLPAYLPDLPFLTCYASITYYATLLVHSLFVVLSASIPRRVSCYAVMLMCYAVTLLRPSITPPSPQSSAQPGLTPKLMHSTYLPPT